MLAGDGTSSSQTLPSLSTVTLVPTVRENSRWPASTFMAHLASIHGSSFDHLSRRQEQQWHHWESLARQQRSLSSSSLEIGSLFNLTGRKWCSFFLPHCRLFAFPHRCTRALYSSHHQTTFGRSSSVQFCSVFDGRTFSTSGRSWHSRCCRSTTCDSSFSGGRASSLPCLWWHQSMLSDWLIRSMQFQ